MGEDNTIDGVEHVYMHIYIHNYTSEKQTNIQTKSDRNIKESCDKDTYMSIALLWGESVCNLSKFGGWETCEFAQWGN
jgi:hypothetical protein